MNIYEMIRSQMGAALPFATLTGIELSEVAAGKGAAKLSQRPEICNHVGSIHAGAIFTLGEAASGAAMSGTFAEHIMAIRPLAAEAKVTYAKIAKGLLIANAATTEPADDILSRFIADGKAKFDIEVDITNEDNETVATMSVAWNVRRA